MGEVRHIDVVGKFPAEIVQPEVGWFAQMGEKESAYIRIPVRVIDDGRGGTDVQHIGKTGIYRAWLTDTAFDKTIARLVQAIPEWDGDLDALYRNETTLAGHKVDITVGSEMYEGKLQYKIQWLDAIGSGPKPMDAAKVQSLLGKLGARAKAIAKDTKKKLNIAPAPAAAAATPAPDKSVSDDVDVADDAPF